MDQIVEVPPQQEVITVNSSSSSTSTEYHRQQRDAREDSLMRHLWSRLRQHMGRQALEEAVSQDGSGGDNHLQDILNEVSGQVPEVPQPVEDAPSSSGDVEKCTVCRRSFRHRGPTVTCAGCSFRVHKQYCVRYLTMSENLRVGMCNICCYRVQRLILEVRILGASRFHLETRALDEEIGKVLFKRNWTGIPSP